MECVKVGSRTDHFVDGGCVDPRMTVQDSPRQTDVFIVCIRRAAEVKIDYEYREEGRPAITNEAMTNMMVITPATQPKKKQPRYWRKVMPRLVLP